MTQITDTLHEVLRTLRTKYLLVKTTHSLWGMGCSQRKIWRCIRTIQRSRHFRNKYKKYNTSHFPGYQLQPTTIMVLRYEDVLYNVCYVKRGKANFNTLIVSVKNNQEFKPLGQKKPPQTSWSADIPPNFLYVLAQSGNSKTWNPTSRTLPCLPRCDLSVSETWK